MTEKKIRHTLRPVITVLASVLMAVNIRMFVKVGGLYPGGATGLTVLTQAICERFFNLDVPYTIVNIAWNAVPVYIGFRYIGKKFTMYSLIMILLSGFLVDMIPPLSITYDLLLIAVFGGIINGFVVSLCLSFHTTTGGTDFISIFLSQKYNMDTFNLVLGLNIVILGIAGVLFGWDKALYSIVFQFVSTQMLHMLYQKYQKKTLFIVTNKPQDVCQVIDDISNHGATVLEGEGSYEHCERNVVYSVVSSAECKKVVHAIRQTDPKAFVNTLQTDQLSGRFYQKPVE